MATDGKDSKPVIPDRVTIVEMVYHQQFNGQPFVFESKFSSTCEESEQPYQRYTKVVEQWQPLDCGWLRGRAGVILICNEEGKNLPANPSEKEKFEIASRVVEIRHDGDKHSFIVPPKESIRIRTTDDAKLLVRCLCGPAKIALCVFAR